MKVIDLYDMVANELLQWEDYPEKIMIEKQPFTLRQDCGGYYWYGREYDHKSIERSFCKNLQEILTLPVEIIEEDKKIEKLDIYNCFEVMGIDKTGRLDENFTDISNKINEIIDYLNKEKE